MPANDKQWQSYEAVAAFLLNDIAAKLGLAHVEGKQQLTATESGTTWEIDAKGVRADEHEGFVIIECKRYPKDKVNQEQVGGLAYRIKDTGAAGGIFVTPIGLQAGAEKIATHEGIQTVHLDANSTREGYILRFLNDVFVGVTDTITVTDEVSVVIRHED